MLTTAKIAIEMCFIPVLCQLSRNWCFRRAIMPNI